MYVEEKTGGSGADGVGRFADVQAAIAQRYVADLQGGATADRVKGHTVSTGGGDQSPTVQVPLHS